MTKPLAEFTTADVLALVAATSFVPFSSLRRASQWEFADASQTSLVGFPGTDWTDIQGSCRVVLLDPEQASVDVIDLYDSQIEGEPDPAIRVRLGKVEVCD